MGKRKFVVCNAVMAASDLIVLNNVPAQDISIEGEPINSVPRQGEGSQREHRFPVHAGQLDEPIVQQSADTGPSPARSGRRRAKHGCPQPLWPPSVSNKDRSWRSSVGEPHQDSVLNAKDADPRSRPRDGVRL
jgi:hypothetical protein